MSINIQDLVSVPTRQQLHDMIRASTLFTRVFKTNAYHGEPVGNEELRLDAWFWHHDDKSGSYRSEGQEAASLFRHHVKNNGESVFGPWVQKFNLNNPSITITVVHELAHLLDRYEDHPRTAWTSSGRNFDPIFEKYQYTESAYILLMLSKGKFPTLYGPEEIIIEPPTDKEVREKIQQRAHEMRKRHEVIARCVTAYLFYENIDMSSSEERIRDEFHALVRSRVNQIYGYDLSREDYEIIRAPLIAALKEVKWIA